MEEINPKEFFVPRISPSRLRTAPGQAPEQAELVQRLRGQENTTHGPGLPAWVSPGRTQTSPIPEERSWSLAALTIVNPCWKEQSLLFTLKSPSSSPMGDFPVPGLICVTSQARTPFLCPKDAIMSLWPYFPAQAIPKQSFPRTPGSLHKFYPQISQGLLFCSPTQRGPELHPNPIGEEGVWCVLLVTEHPLDLFSAPEPEGHILPEFKILFPPFIHVIC